MKTLFIQAKRVVRAFFAVVATLLLMAVVGYVAASLYKAVGVIGRIDGMYNKSSDNFDFMLAFFMSRWVYIAGVVVTTWLLCDLLQGWGLFMRTGLQRFVWEEPRGIGVLSMAVIALGMFGPFIAEWVIRMFTQTPPPY